MYGYLVLGFIAALAALIIALQNPLVIPLKFLHWQVQWALTVLLLAAFAMGALCVFVLMIPGMVRKSRCIAKLKQELEEAKEDPEEEKVTEFKEEYRE